MKLLISAYACEPNKGSEAGVGWHWVIEVARLGHDVWVLTRRNNRCTIQRVLPDVANLRFVYYDLPHWAARLKKRGPFLSLYYLLWQWGAYRRARELHSQVQFDAVQHLTFGAFRYPSFMGRLGTRFVFGPVGGGERSPMRLRRDYGVKGQIMDGLRDLANLIAPFNPWLNETFNAAEWILAKTPETRAALPRRYREKTICAIEIGAPERIQRDSVTAPDDGAIRFLFVGTISVLEGRAVRPARLCEVGAGSPERPPHYGWCRTGR